MKPAGPYGPMGDFARSDDPAVQRQLDRLFALSIARERPTLGPVTALLERIGDPQHRLPPVLHVAGTNGKGSTCAFLRAAIEGAGLAAHVYTSPHLVRFNERIRIAGALVDDAVLAPLLEEVLDAGGDIGASFFEVSTAAAMLAFSRTPADACILEVGMGGSFDATNVVSRPCVTAIAQLGLDHQFFLGDTVEAIAVQKAGIARPGVPLVTMCYPAGVAAAIARAAPDSPLVVEGDAWHWSVAADRLRYRDASGDLETPLPTLSGPHQPANLALAVAMLRHQDRVPVPYAALQTAPLAARWPGRMQELDRGPLTDLLPPGTRLWLDGGHNPAAARAVADALESLPSPRHLILGMLANKDPRGLLEPIAPLVQGFTAVPVPGHEHHAPEVLGAIARDLGIANSGTATDLAAALTGIATRPRPGPATVLILGSLYLAGIALGANAELPD